MKNYFSDLPKKLVYLLLAGGAVLFIAGFGAVPPGIESNMDRLKPSQSLLLSEEILARPNTPLVPWRCGQWFLSGVNVPWQPGDTGYGSDFGTVEEWANHHTYSATATAQMFAALKAAGANTARWWVFTDGRGAPEFDAVVGGAVTGLDADFLPSLASAVKLAEQHDIYLVLTLWDFGMLDDDGTPADDGEHAGGHRDLIVEAAKRQSFIDNALIPMLQHPIPGTGYTLGDHPHILAWEIINEPEWGISESGAVDPDISQPVSLAEMQRFVADIAAALHQNAAQLVTLGSASLKWNSDTALGATGNWWSDADLTPYAADGYLDFYQVHYYSWMNGDEVAWSYSPLFNDVTKASFDKPVVVGEFPANANGLGLSVGQTLQTLYDNGYAGAWAWSYEDIGEGGWSDSQAAYATFKAAHAAEVDIEDVCAGSGEAAIPDPIADRILGQAAFNTNSSGGGQAGLNGPAGVVVGPDGRLFVVDYGNHRVLSWADATDLTNGQAADLVLGQPDFNTTFGGSSLNKMEGPESIAVDSAGRVYVADSGNHRVLIFTPPLSTGMAAGLTFGTYQAVLSNPPPLQNLFNFPRGLALDAQNNLYLVDEFHGRALVYLSPMTTDTTPDHQFLNLNDPRGVAVDSAGNVYITDSENDRVLAYDAPLAGNNFTPDHTFGGSDGSHLDCLGAVTVNNNPSQTSMSCPIDVAVDSADNLYVSDIFNHRILVYHNPLTDVTPDAVFGQPDFNSSQPNQVGGVPGTTTLNNPLGMTFDARGTLYVADFNNHRLLGFKAPPASLLDVNLIENGDAEASAGSNDGSTFAPASWRATQGNFTAVQYGADGGFPEAADPGPDARGANFFGGGLASDTTFAEQVIDVSTLSAKLDDGEINFTVSGYFGGFADQEDTAGLEINFQDEAGGFIDQVRLGDFTAAERQNQTGLLPDSAEGVAPAGTRRIQIILQMQRLGGFNFNDGYADNMAFVLSDGETGGEAVSLFLPVILK